MRSVSVHGMDRTKPINAKKECVRSIRFGVRGGGIISNSVRSVRHCVWFATQRIPSPLSRSRNFAVPR